MVQHLVPARTSDAGLFDRVEDAFGVDTLLQIFLCLFTEFIILHCDLPDKFEVLFKLVTRLFMVVIELHASDARILGWAHTERGHTTAVYIQGTVGEEVEEEAVIRFLWISDVLREVLVIVDRIKGWWIVN